MLVKFLEVVLFSIKSGANQPPLDQFDSSSKPLRKDLFPNLKLKFLGDFFSEKPLN